MDFRKNKPPRKYQPVIDSDVEILDYGKIKLETNEQVSFINDNKKEYDFVAKEWGFYATPSINARLVDEGFKTALVKNKQNKYYIMVVDKEKIKIFQTYMLKSRQEIIEWLDELN